MAYMLWKIYHGDGDGVCIGSGGVVQRSRVVRGADTAFYQDIKGAQTEHDPTFLTSISLAENSPEHIETSSHIERSF